METFEYSPPPIHHPNQFACFHLVILLFILFFFAGGGRGVWVATKSDFFWGVGGGVGEVMFGLLLG